MVKHTSVHANRVALDTLLFTLTVHNRTAAFQVVLQLIKFNRQVKVC